jgi:CubicO group peptidase (beta-lactamase class C family)
MSKLVFFIKLLLFLGCFSCQKSPIISVPLPLTTNPLKTPLDSAIHRAALGLLKDRPDLSFMVGVNKAGQSKLYAYGSVEKGKQKLPTENTLYELGEVTGLLTSLAVVQRMQEKGYDLMAPAQDYINLPADLQLGAADQPVTMDKLLREHIPLPVFPPGIKDINDSAFQNFSKDQLFEYLSQYKYPGLGRIGSYYLSKALLGIFLEQEYGQGYEFWYYDFLRPALGLNQSKVITGLIDEADYPPGYDLLGKPSSPWIGKGVFKSALGVKVTAKDMLRLLELQLYADQSSWGKAIKLVQPQYLLNIPGYSLQPNQIDYLYNFGSTSGFRASICFHPERKIGAFFLSNHQTGILGGEAADFFEAL